MEPDLLTIPDAMARLKLGRSTIYDLIRTKRLESVKVGASRRIPTPAIARFIKTLIEEVV